MRFEALFDKILARQASEADTVKRARSEFKHSAQKSFAQRTSFDPEEVQTREYEIRMHVRNLGRWGSPEAMRALRTPADCGAHEVRAHMCNADPFPPLLSLLQSAWCAARMDAAIPLGDLAASMDGCIPELVQVLQTSANDGIKEQVARALRNLAVNSESRSMAVKKAGGISLLLNLLRTGNAKAKEHAAVALQGATYCTASGQQDILACCAAPLLSWTCLGPVPTRPKRMLRSFCRLWRPKAGQEWAPFTLTGPHEMPFRKRAPFLPWWPCSTTAPTKPRSVLSILDQVHVLLRVEQSCGL